MKKLAFQLVITVIFFGVTSVLAQNAYVVKDISSVKKSAKPSYLTINNNELYFFADDGIHGNELWKTDGTVPGTSLAKDINPSGDALNSANISNTLKFISIKNILYFDADDGTNGMDLWRTDGTATGTFMIKNITTSWDQQPEFLTNFKDTLYFSCAGSLWKSDGTESGTILIKNGGNPKNLIAFGNKLFFYGSDGLYQSDGTTAGTTLVKAMTDVQNFVPYKNKLYFSANSQLWLTDGTVTGTVAVLNSDGVAIPNPRSLAVSNNILFIGSRDTGFDGLWKTDGTQGGTTRIKEFNSIYSGDPLDLTDVNGVLYFVAHDSTVGTLEALNRSLWKSDGTTNGTQFVKVINSTNPYVSNSFTSFQSTLFMCAYDATNGYELWKSDGTANGTSLIKNIFPGDGNSSPHSFTILNNKLIFIADDSEHGNSLWMTDGTTVGTKLLLDVNNTLESNIVHLTKVNNKLFFSAKTTANGDELWVSDGSDAGTNMVIDLAPPNKIGPDYLTELNGFCYFYSPNTTSAGIYKSDGTATGTELIKDWYVQGMGKIDNKLYGTYPGFWMSDGTTAGTITISNGSTPEKLVSMNGNYYFPSYGKLYKTAGTTAGIELLESFQYCSDLISTTNSIYFTAVPPDTSKGMGLWKSNGTANGAVLVKKINASKLMQINGTIYFSGDTTYSNAELWKSDGTLAGTVLVKDINPGGSSNLSYLTNVNGVLYFTANDGVHGQELWKSDGTAIGTVLVKDINSGASDAFSKVNDPLPYFTYAGGVLFFSADNGVNGYELWQSDGTVAGTKLADDMNPGGSSIPKEITLVDERLFFTATKANNGRYLWAKDITNVTNCYAHFTTAYETLKNNFIVTVDPITLKKAVSYLWDFGDGTTSTLANPSHTYTADSIYNLCMKIHTASGDSCTYCHKIGKDSLGNVVRSSGFTISVKGTVTPIENGLSSNEKKFTVYPNPSKGEAEILFVQQLTNANISILNVVGQRVVQKMNVTGTEFKIDISNQAQGIYFIEIESNGETLRTKLIKNE
jgi:ELWxxDGT repeat protein